MGHRQKWKKTHQRQDHVLGLSQGVVLKWVHQCKYLTRHGDIKSAKACLHTCATKINAPCWSASPPLIAQRATLSFFFIFRVVGVVDVIDIVECRSLFRCFFFSNYFFYLWQPDGRKEARKEGVSFCLFYVSRVPKYVEMYAALNNYCCHKIQFCIILRWTHKSEG